MMKKFLLAALSLSIVGVAADAAFMNGPSVGLDIGFLSNKAGAIRNPAAKYADYNTPAIGLHADYNSIVSRLIFIGTGLEANFSLKNPKIKGGDDKITFKRSASGAIVLRMGTIASPVAFDVNGAFLFTQWKFEGKRDAGRVHNKLRAGFGPGVAMTVDVAKNVSCGVSYRFETYPKGSRTPRFEGHLVLLKLNYQF